MAVEYTSGALRFSGLGNGTDFDTMITQLKKIEMMPFNRMAKWRDDWQKRTDAFKEVRKELLSLRNVAMKLNTVDKFLAKGVASSKDTVASATANSQALEGVYRVDVAQLATNAIYSMNTSLSDPNKSVNTTLVDQTFSYRYAGKDVTIKVPKDTSLENLKNLINNDSSNPGVRASVIKTAGGYTFQLKGMGLGSENSLSITKSTVDAFSNGTLPTYTALYNPSTSITDKTTAQVNDLTTLNVSLGLVTTSMSIPANSSLQSIASQINAIAGVKATVVENTTTSPHTFFLQVSNSATNGNIPVIIEPNDKLAVFGLDKGPTFQDVTSFGTAYASSATIGSANNSGAVAKFRIQANGAQVSFDLPDKSSLNDLMNLINTETSKTGVQASIVANKSTGGQDLVLTNLYGDSAVGVFYDANVPVFSSTASVGPHYGGWEVQQSQDAKIKVNGWPNNSWLTLSSNTTTDAIEGLTLNLKDVGTTVLTVTMDTAKIKDNVQEYMDAINSFRLKIQELTKFDDNKKVQKPEDAKSQWEMQKGSVLTGNYGVQLLSSQIKQVTAGMPLGFDRNADAFSALSQLGILTYATGNAGAENFGMLTFDANSVKSFEQALAENPQAVAEFFAADNIGISDSSDFSFAGQVKGLTKAGVYNVTYELDAAGKIKDGTAFINGKAAKYYADTHQIGLVRGSGADNDADGIMISIDNMTPNTTYSGTARIKRGAVNELMNMFNGPSLKPEEGLLGSSGSLGILEANYQKIMDNIETKMDKERQRIIKWERMTRSRFSRLEATLSRYDNLGKSIESQVKQLSSSSK